MAISNVFVNQGGVNAKDCTADASKILEGYTAAVGKEIVEGTMPNNGDADTAVQNGMILEGYTSGGQIDGLTAENIKNGAVVGGVSGTAGVAGVTFKLVGSGSFPFTSSCNSGGSGGSNHNGTQLGKISISEYDNVSVSSFGITKYKLRSFKEMVFTTGSNAHGDTASATSPITYKIVYASSASSPYTCTFKAFSEDSSDLDAAGIAMTWYSGYHMRYYSTSSAGAATGYVTYEDYEVI